MKILLCGGGSGGHITPLIAVARELRTIAEEQKLVTVDLVFVGDSNDPHLFAAEDIRFRRLASGKVRRYFSFQNVTDLFRTAGALLKAVYIVYQEFPDVVFSKGGFASFPVLVAARLFSIPVIIHESDTVPGRVHAWAASFARRIAVSFPETLAQFPSEKTAYTGNPIRTRILGGNEAEATALFSLEQHVPVILVLGGSQGAEPLNNAVLSVIDTLVETSQVIHQTGEKNYANVMKEASVVLEKSTHRHRHHIIAFLDEGALRNAASMARVIVSRAGANAIFEIAAWGVPSILVPLPHAAQDHQRHNAYVYARAGGCVVIEEENLTPTVFLNEVQKLVTDEERRTRMRTAAQKFARLDAAEKIAREIIQLGFHETE